MFLRTGLDALEKRKYLASCRRQTQSLVHTVMVKSLPDFTGRYKKIALTFENETVDKNLFKNAINYLRDCKIIRKHCPLVNS